MEIMEIKNNNYYYYCFTVHTSITYVNYKDNIIGYNVWQTGKG